MVTVDSTVLYIVSVAGLVTVVKVDWVSLADSGVLLSTNVLDELDGVDEELNTGGEADGKTDVKGVLVLDATV